MTREIQRELFIISAAVANPLATKKEPPDVTPQMVERLTMEVNRIEAMEGILSDWSLPGDHAAAAAYDVARTICRRAERCIVRLKEVGEEVGAETLAYVNRLSDLLWLMGRLLEMRAGVDSSLRDEKHGGPSWSRAW
jgi:cob(I)alamin adenosyltransferase